MRRLVTILCLTLTVLLGSAGIYYPVFASEVVKKKFGEITLNIPYPDNLCLLGERELPFKHQKEVQKKSNAKLLAYWTDCETQELLYKATTNVSWREWMLVTATLSGNPRRERVFPKKFTNEAFQKIMLKKLGDVMSKLDAIIERTQKRIEGVNSMLLGGKDVISVRDPISLGVIGVTDSIHTGLIMNVKFGQQSRAILAVSSSGLIRGAPVSFIFYKPYENKNSIKALLQKAKYYSVKINHAN